MKIDTHIHAYTDSLAERVVKKLCEEGKLERLGRGHYRVLEKETEQQAKQAAF